MVWQCYTYVEYGSKKCDTLTIQESDLQDAVVKAIHKMLERKDTSCLFLEKNIRVTL